MNLVSIMNYTTMPQLSVVLGCSSDELFAGWAGWVASYLHIPVTPLILCE